MLNYGLFPAVTDNDISQDVAFGKDKYAKHLKFPRLFQIL